MRLLAALVLALCLVQPLPARAAEPTLDAGLMRLAEVIGSLHFLRGLCSGSSPWRDEMEKLLQSEQPDPGRRAKLVASFNRGYRSFAYSSCNASAEAAIVRFMREGEALSRDLAAQYGN